MKNVVLVLIISLFCIAGTLPKLSKRKLTDGVSALMPKEFIPMSDDDIALKYPSTKKPLAMYISPDRVTDFGLNVSKSKFPGGDIKLLSQIYKSTILDAYNKVSFIQEGVKLVNKREYAVFEYTSEFQGTRKYNYLQYTIVKNQVLIFNFSTNQSGMQQWQPIANAMMNSAKIKEGSLKLPEMEQQDRKGKSPQEVLEMQKTNNPKNKK